MISYEPLWSTMRRKGVTTYTLIKDYSFSRGTLDSLKHNRNISTATLNDLCNILSCRVEAVSVHTPDAASKRRFQSMVFPCRKRLLFQIKRAAGSTNEQSFTCSALLCSALLCSALLSVYGAWFILVIPF